MKNANYKKEIERQREGRKKEKIESEFIDLVVGLYLRNIKNTTE